MKLLVNICAHDGIISHYNGVGTMASRYIDMMIKILKEREIDYHINLFTPEYYSFSFGYSKQKEDEHSKLDNVTIYKVSNGSNGKVNYGTIDNWKELSINTAKIINNLNIDEYDLELTLANDTPFAGLISLLNDDKHIKVWIPHSTIKIHEVDSAIPDSKKFYDIRLKWEIDAINYINKNKNSYIGAIGNFILEHLIKEYGLNKEKVLHITNGEIIEKKNYQFSPENKELFKEIEDLDTILLSFGRAEEYKNLKATMDLGEALNIPAVVIAQSYYKTQPILDDYRNYKKDNTLLFIDPPFDFSKYILNNFKGNIVMVVPSIKEIMCLIINEVRLLNKDNILIVSNDVNGLNEQIDDLENGILVDLNDIKSSALKIRKYLDKDIMKKMNSNSWELINKKYNFYNNMNIFINEVIERTDNNA